MQMAVAIAFCCGRRRAEGIPHLVATKLLRLQHHHTSCSGHRSRIFHVSCRCVDVDCLFATKLQLCSGFPKARASAFASSGRYQVVIMQRGPPRIGIPHLVATKFDIR